MRTFIFAALVLSCGATEAQVYKCPQVYPGKHRPAQPLTSASMAWGEDRDGLFAGDYSEAVPEGYDLHFPPFMDDQPAWLICSYGSKKRNKGRFHNGHEWNQRMDWSMIEWWVRLAPKAGVCDVQVREIKARSPNKSTWTATAICKPPEP